MFIVYAVPLGLLAGLVRGGRIEGLARLRFRWAPVVAAALVGQVVLFSGTVDGVIGSWGPVLYVGSTTAVLVAVLRNLAIPGLVLVAVGAVSNLAAIVANGGCMPTDRATLEAAGFAGEAATFSNSCLRDAPALRPLTDIFALPAAFPLSNVFSVGDLLIGLGIAATIALAMWRAPRVPTPVRAGNSPD